MSTVIDAQTVWHVAAENGALPGGKIGGIGDVIRDLPRALDKQGIKSAVLTPGYGSLSRLEGARPLRGIGVTFAGRRRVVRIWQVPGPDADIRHLVFEHELFQAQGRGRIYVNSGPQRPFADDATKFAFFCQAVAYFLLRTRPRPAIVHLHDWHAGLLLALRRLDPALRALMDIRMPYTIHNLGLQGIRPLAGDPSSFAEWFPALDRQDPLLRDPRYADCVNPMAVGIRAADFVTTVSPTYAREILRPGQSADGDGGGEGLDADLRRVAAEGRLAGILNGCEYPVRTLPRVEWGTFAAVARQQVADWQRADASDRAAPIAAARLERLANERPRHWLLSVGRITAQKVALFLEPADGIAALQSILSRLGNDGVLVMIGNGDAELERRLAGIAKASENFLFLRGFAWQLSELAYRGADLFLMPSSFEPCGISQLLAMRAGQPCVVHAVGGLSDTVRDLETGFAFGGDTRAEQAQQFVATVVRALRIRTGEPERWNAICQAAAAERFSWDASVQRYIDEVYAL